MSAFSKLLFRLFRVPQTAACRYLKYLDEQVLVRYRNDRCVYEDRLESPDFLSSAEKTTIPSILQSDGCSVQGNQILCISAEPGYGKDFLAKRICTLNYSYTYPNTQAISPYSDPFSTHGPGRMPFIIQKEDVEDYFRKEADGTAANSNPLCWVCAASMMRVLDQCSPAKRWKPLHNDKSRRKLFKLLLERLQKPLEAGNLFVLFQKDAMSAQSTALDTILAADPSANDAATRKNLLVFVLDSVGQNSLRWAPYHVVLTPLTKEEVLAHVASCPGSSEEIVREFEALFTAIPACTIPDCLLFLTETHIGENIPSVVTAADLYRDCIRKAVEARFRSQSIDVEEVLRLLRGYAWSTYCGQLLSLPDNVAEQLMYKKGSRNHLLNETKMFRFEGCREYLIAEKLYEKLLGDPEDRWDNRPLKQANGNIKARLLEIVIGHYKELQSEGKDLDPQIDKVLQRFWEAILSQGTVIPYSEMEFLTRFLTELDAADGPVEIETYQKEYLQQAILQMEERVYDNRLFQLFSDTNRKMKGYKFNKQLREKYLSNVEDQAGEQNEDEKRRKDRFNRRFLFYTGRHSEVGPLIEGIYNENLSRHMKYHLMRAMRDNCFAGNSKEAIRAQLERMVSYGEQSGDQILLLNVLVLQLLLMDVSLDGRRFEKSLLLEYLDDEAYWIRAHAADVIAYIVDDISIPEKLAEAIAKETSREEEGYLRLKVINHMAEAVCEFYFFRARQGLSSSENVEDYQFKAIKRMLSLIQLKSMESNEERLTAMSMYATIAESVNYLLEGGYSARPAFIGVHVSDGKGQWDQNEALVTEMLKAAAKRYADQEIEAILHNFQDDLDNIMKRELAAQGRWPLPLPPPEWKPDPKNQEVVSTTKKETDSLHDRKDGASVTNNFYGPVGAVTESGDVTVHQNNSAQSPQDAAQLIDQLEEVLGKQCSKEQLEAAKPILQELRDVANGTAPAPADKKSWTNRLLHALAITADVLTIAQAPWWPQVQGLTQGIAGMLPQ